MGKVKDKRFSPSFSSTYLNLAELERDPISFPSSSPSSVEVIGGMF